jgi:hypothetical protein
MSNMAVRLRFVCIDQMHEWMQRDGKAWLDSSTKKANTHKTYIIRVHVPTL